MSVEQELTHTTFLQREYNFKHTTYNDEISTMSAIRHGDVEKARHIIDTFLDDGCGHLSDDPSRNAQYMFVAGITLMTRFAIEGGMLEKDAFNLSDLYIQKMDQCRASLTDIRALYEQASLDFATRVHKLQKSNVYSKPVLLAVDYIYDNLHYNISVEEVAREVNLSPSYFSALFKKETGVSVASYIRNMRIEAAKNMLQFSDYSYQDIGNYLAFSSQSHFISTFKKQVGMTPKEYRIKHFSTNWRN